MRYRVTSSARNTFVEFEDIESAMGFLNKVKLSQESVVIIEKKTGKIVFQKTYN